MDSPAAAVTASGTIPWFFLFCSISPPIGLYSIVTCLSLLTFLILRVRSVSTATTSAIAVGAPSVEKSSTIRRSLTRFWMAETSEYVLLDSSAPPKMGSNFARDCDSTAMKSAMMLDAVENPACCPTKHRNLAVYEYCCWV